MPRTKISEFSATAGSNTDIDGINIAEGCSPSGINDAIRELMSQLKDFQAGTAGDSFNGPVGTTTAAAGAFTTLSASSTVSGAGFSTYLASPPAIGGTVAAAGSFTTLSASSSVTLSGGTANGVAYLNGSKVLTTGSALTFDGTSLTFGTTSQRIIGDMSNATQSNRLFAQTSTSNTSTSFGVLPNGTSGVSQFAAYGASDPTNTARMRVGVDSAGAYLISDITGTGSYLPLRFLTDGTESMRLTSTGLGIGTSSPSAGLHINKAFGSQFRIQEAGGTYFDIAAGGRFDLKNAAGTTIVSIAQSGSPVGTQLNLDSSGNLGLGVTPSAWGSAYKAFEGNYGTNFSFDTNNPAAIVATNAYHNGTNWIYKISSYGAMRFAAEASNGFKFFTAPSGTAGNAISFTQAMTLTSGGNLLVKTTADNGVTCHFNGGANNNIIRLTGASTTNSGYIGMDGDNFTISTGASILERARITSGGNLLVGTTTNNASGGVIQVSNGITFPATQSASSDANTLDDYEEGSWTPSQGAGLTVVGAFSSTGTYTKIGNLVYVRGYVAGATSVSVTAAGVITGNLPFTNAASDSCGGNATNYQVNQTSGTYVSGSTTTLYASSALTASAQIIFSITYRV